MRRAPPRLLSSSPAPPAAARRRLSAPSGLSRAARAGRRYIPSPYSIADSLAREERIHDAEAVEKAGHKAPFRMSDTTMKLKHEDAFHGDFNAFFNGPDPYERADDQALRHKWLEEAQILAGPFRPSGRVKGAMGESATERPAPSKMPEIVEQLRMAIEADWEYAFIVCATDDEHIVVRFEMSTLDSEPGLVAYMNLFARTNHVVSKFLLKKVVEDWNVTPGDGHLYFTFRPPWVNVRPTDTFFSLHPEQRSFQDPRLSKAAADFGPDAGLAQIESALAGAGSPGATGGAADGLSLRPELT